MQEILSGILLALLIIILMSRAALMEMSMKNIVKKSDGIFNCN